MKKLLITIVIIIIVLVAGGLWYSHRSLWRSGSTATSTAPISSEPMNVSTFDLASALSNASSTPAGFPADLPIHATNVSEQNKLEYPDRGTTLYSISYTTTETPSAAASLYKKYFSANKYSLESTGTTTPALTSLTADKGTDSISVVITPNASGSLVQLGLVHRTQ